MSAEYFIKSTDGTPDRDVWDAVVRQAERCTIKVVTEDGCLLFKDELGENDWDFDVRIFGPSPILLEISSWGDRTRRAIAEMISNVARTHPVSIVDEDGEALQW